MYDYTRLPWELDCNFDAAIPLNIDSLPSASPALNKLVEEIFEAAGVASLIKAKQPAKVRSAHNRLIKVLTSLMWYLYKAAKAGQDFFVLASFRHAAFSPPSEYNPHGVTRLWIMVAKLLGKRWLLDIYQGFYCRDTCSGKLTRLRSTPKLYEALVALPPNIREDAAARPCIVVRDRETKKLSSLSEYSVHPKVVKNLETLTRYNEFIESKNIDFGARHVGQLAFTDRKGNSCAIDPSNKHLHAVFHIDAAQRLTYGRLHGPFWQVLPSVWREELHINGQGTIELDYRAQSLSIVASLSGVQLEGDPYELEFRECNLPSCNQRELVKLATVMMLNNSSKRSAFDALRGKKKTSNRFRGVKFTNVFLDDLYDRMFTKHSFLKDWAFRDKGMSVFEEDAEIARRIVELSTAEGVPVLPIHDGFIVQDESEEFLRDAMDQVWFDRFGTRIGIA